MDKIPEKKKSSTTLVVVLVMLLMLYVLSIGPAVRLTTSVSGFGGAPPISSPITLRAFMRFYAPLIWLVRHNRWLQEPTSKYIDVWQKL